MDSELDLIRAWFAYIADTRRGYLDTLAELPLAELARDRGASFPSLIDIFAPSQGALYFRMKDCAMLPFASQEGESSGPPTLEDLKKDERYIQSQIPRVMVELTEADLSRTIARV
jgi:hypothetical protein